MMDNFNERLNLYIKKINAALDAYLPPIGGKYDIVRRAMRYSVDAGGKRARPILTAEFARINGIEMQDAMPFACAVELVHTYSLIHDDLPCMDNDELRRGKPSCHIAFGEANALLAGDALLTDAFELISRAPELSGLSEASCVKATRILAQHSGVFGMIGGQTMDLENEGKQLDAETLKKTHLLKTSALLSAACALGAVAAEAEDSMISTALQYGEFLGLAFQTVDDILDVTGDSKSMGKPIGSDQENQKITMVSMYTLDGAKKIAEDLTMQALEMIRSLPNNEFLLELTCRLLTRHN